MDFSIPEELERLRTMMAQYIEREVKPAVQEAKRDEYGEIDPEVETRIRKRSVELGFYAIEMPEEYGGMDLNTFGSVILHEEYTRHFPGFGEGAPIIGASLSGPDKMWLKGTPEQIEKYFWPLVRGEKLTCFGLSEPGAGSDNQAMTTRAIRDGDNFIINGTKHFISGAHKADFLRVYAVTDPEKKARGGITCFIVDKNNPGFKIARRMPTMGNMAPCELHFEDCAVPVNEVLGEIGRGFYLGMEHLNASRITMAAGSLGTAEFCLKGAIAYAKQRVTFGLPLAERQAIQWMLVDTATELMAARTMTYSAAWMDDQKERDIRAEAAMAKLFASEMVCRAADMAIQVHGGIGYTTDLPYERIYRQVRLLRIGEGASEIMRILIARQLLKG